MEKFLYMIGKTKEEVLNELGDEFNFFLDPVWTYALKTKWWERKKTLHLYFTDDTVKSIEILKTFVRKNNQ